MWSADVVPPAAPATERVTVPLPATSISYLPVDGVDRLFIAERSPPKETPLMLEPLVLQLVPIAPSRAEAISAPVWSAVSLSPTPLALTILMPSLQRSTTLPVSRPLSSTELLAPMMVRPTQPP